MKIKHWLATLAAVLVLVGFVIWQVYPSLPQTPMGWLGFLLFGVPAYLIGESLTVGGITGTGKLRITRVVIGVLAVLVLMGIILVFIPTSPG